MINVTELRPGNYFIEEGNIYKVLDILLNKTAMRKMVASVKVKNMRTGSVTEISRNSGYAIENIRLDKKSMQTGLRFVILAFSAYIFGCVEGPVPSGSRFAPPNHPQAAGSPCHR